MTSFLIDTANIDDIDRILDKVMPHVELTAFEGITTNPSALSKVNCDTLDKLETLAYKLTRLISKTRGDHNGALHIQLPYSHATKEEIEKWIRYLSELGDRSTKIVMKAPPYAHVLDIIQDVTKDNGRVLQHINVTGIADAATALRCMNHPSVSYVSIIPGRMEEVGINADSHIRVVQQRRSIRANLVNYERVNDQAQVITGSMRTLEGLYRSIKLGTLPTIGTRVWDLMTTDEDYKNFSHFWNDINIPLEYEVPITDQRNVDLTKQFFSQMDTLGNNLYLASKEL